MAAESVDQQILSRRVRVSATPGWIAFAVYSMIAVGVVFALSPLSGRKQRSLPDYMEAHYSHPAFVHGELAKQVSVGETQFLFRGGLDHAGIAPAASLGPGLREVWRKNDFNIGVHGASKASPAVDDSGVYIGNDAGWFYAFDHDGTVRWRFFTGVTNSRGIHSTAATDTDRVYFGAYNGYLYCVRKSDGKLIWAREMGIAIGASISIHGDSLLVAPETGNPYNGFLVRVRRSDGEIVWMSTPLGEQSHSTPTVLPEKDLVILGVNNSTIQAYRLSSGRKAWQVEIDGPLKSTIAYARGKLFASSFGQTVRAYDPESGKLLWSTKVDRGTSGSPTYVPGLNLVIVTVAGDTFYGLNADTGAVVWRAELSKPPRFEVEIIRPSGTLVRSPKGPFPWLLWVGCKQKSLCALNPATGAIVREYPLDGMLNGVPTAYGKSIYLSTRAPGSFFRLDASE